LREGLRRYVADARRRAGNDDHFAGVLHVALLADRMPGRKSEARVF
jgi:hypothetical protein